MSRLALQLTCFNGSKYLVHLFESLAGQACKDWTLYVLDNGSSSEEAILIKAAVDACSFKVVYQRVEDTVNFANGHNLLFAKHDAEFVQLLNDDAFLEPTYLERVIRYMEAHPMHASASGRIFRWNFEAAMKPGKGVTDIIDSFGLERLRTGMVRDRYRGESLQYVPTESLSAQTVFGVSGCLPMYRRTAALASSPDGMLFDPTFTSYKEDVEIAYRLAALGFLSAIVHDAVAYHRRTFARGGHAAQRVELQLQSYRNHLWILFMHMSFRTALTSGWAILPFELAKIAYWVVRGPRVLVDAWRQTRHQWCNILRKRRFFMQLARTSGKGHFVPLAHPPAPYVFSIVTVAHDDLNEPYFLSLQKAIANTQHRVQLIIVDNDSKKFRANELVDQYFSQNAITILRNGDFGFGSSSNRGAQEAEGQYLLFLNPDTAISDERFFDQLKAFLDANPEAGIVAPRVHHFDGTLQETCRRFPRWYMPFIQRTFLGGSRFGKTYADSFLLRDYDHLKTRMVDWTQGSALCISKPLFDEVGGFDKRFWMYFEDIDLCRRVWRTGHPVYYFTGTFIGHAYGKASKAKKNVVLDALTNVMAHAHIASWLQYQWKWRHRDHLS